MQTINAEPNNVFTKRIGSTVYKITVHFSQTSTENMDDKIIRLVKTEAASDNRRDSEKTWQNFKMGSYKPPVMCYNGFATDEPAAERGSI
jgi:hypothetical protein